MLAKLFLMCASAIAGAALMMWPAFYNGQPFFFPDTTAYVRGADAAAQRLTGVATVWTKQAVDHPSVSSIADKTVLAGRSIYYGGLLYLGERVANEWLAVAFQALILTSALMATMVSFGLLRWQYVSILMIIVAVFTSAPLYASFLMPDVFTGLTILACCILLTCDMRGHDARALFWVVLLAVALTFHTTHAILALIMFVLGLGLYLWRRPYVVPRGLAAIGGALVFAYICGAAFNVGVTKLVGAPPLTPPFLMARLIDDGPGFRYIEDTCPGSGFVVCDFRARLPLASDDFLWSHDPEHGVFAVSEPAIRRALSREQYRFAAAVIEHEPWDQFKISVGNALVQAGRVGSSEFSYTDDDKSTFADKVPESYLEVMKTTAAYRGTMPIGLLSALSYLSSVAGLAVIVYLSVFARRDAGRRSHGVIQFMTLVVCGVAANAAVTGVMSGPHDRYEARVAWLLPAAALIAHFSLYRTWWATKLRISP